MAHPSTNYKSFQEFLDSEQYKLSGIRRYEYIFGKGFISPGGNQTTDYFVQKLNIKNGDLVLDVGCGVGGPACHMAKKYGAKVHGIDLSTNMLTLAENYKKEMEVSVQQNVKFEMGDALTMDLEPNYYDVIHTRDVILHMSDKEKLFANFYKWLKPGGKLLITVYSTGSGSSKSQDFDKYCKNRGYHMMSLAEHKNVLEKVGFTQVQATNEASYLIELMEHELVNLMKDEKKYGFVKEFGQKDFDYMVDNWRSKIAWCSNDILDWGLYLATK